MSEENPEELKDWYKRELSLYAGLTNVVHYLLESLIRNAKIDYLSVTSRSKSIESILEKMDRKGYEQPAQEIMDFAGIRVIAFIDSDVRKVCELIRSSFKVHESNSLDKLDGLGVDRFGYRSVHFVCELGDARVKLPEFSLYENRVFEIQVRTALQHAWAEIEHDRNYKFSGVLPTPLQRRLHLLAGVLEMVDREFVSIANEVDQYAKDVSKKTQAGDLDVEINTTSLLQYLPEKIQSIKDVLVKPPRNEKSFNQVIDELRDFGLERLADLEKLFSMDFIESLNKHVYSTSQTGLLRKAMMYEDLDKYFSRAWQNHWREITRSSLNMLKSKYGVEKVAAILSDNKLNPKKNKRTIKQRKNDSHS